MFPRRRWVLDPMWEEVLYSLVTLRNKPSARIVKTPILIIHSRARPHLEVLEVTDHNLSRIFSPSTNARVYVLTAPNARVKMHLPATTRHDRYLEKR